MLTNFYKTNIAFELLENRCYRNAVNFILRN